jgi:hypothetical protein
MKAALPSPADTVEASSLDSSEPRVNNAHADATVPPSQAAAEAKECPRSHAVQSDALPALTAPSAAVAGRAGEVALEEGTMDVRGSNRKRSEDNFPPILPGVAPPSVKSQVLCHNVSPCRARIYQM